MVKVMVVVYHQIATLTARHSDVSCGECGDLDKVLGRVWEVICSDLPRQTKKQEEKEKMVLCRPDKYETRCGNAELVQTRVSGGGAVSYVIASRGGTMSFGRRHSELGRAMLESPF